VYLNYCIIALCGYVASYPYYCIVQRCIFRYGSLDECVESVNYWSVCGVYAFRILVSCIIHVVFVERGCNLFHLYSICNIGLPLISTWHRFKSV
jgi:hypothetical protein